MPISKSWGSSRVAYVSCDGKVAYSSGAELVRKYGPEQVAEWLTAVGYLIVSSTNRRIARLDRTAWKEQMRYELAPMLPTDAECAHYYRKNLTDDSITDVPDNVLQFMLEDTPSRHRFVLFRSKSLLNVHPKTDIIEHETTAMTTTNDIDLSNLPAMTPVQMKTVIVTFDEEGKEYTYFAPIDAKVGDYCVVYAGSAKMTPTTRSMPFHIGRIERETPDLEGKARSAVLGTFNEDFAKVVQQHMDVRSAIKAKLQQKKRQFEERAIFEMLAEKDPEAAALLDALKKFEG